MPHTLHASVTIIRGVGVAFDAFVWEVDDPGFLDIGFGASSPEPQCSIADGQYRCSPPSLLQIPEQPCP